MRLRFVATASAVALVAAGVLTACSSSSGKSGSPSSGAGASSAGASTTGKAASSLTLLVTDSPSASALEAIAPTYTKKFGTKINFVTVSYDQLATKLVLEGQSHSDSFDIAQFDQPTLASIVPAKGLAPLDSYLKSDTSYDASDFAPSLQAYGQLNGVTYGLPLSTEPYVNFYRTDLYAKLHLKPASTWAQVDSNAAAVSALGGKNYGFDGPYGPTLDSGPEWFERLLENGGRLLDPKTFEPQLDTPIAIKTMTDYIALAKKSPPATLSGTAGDSATAFTQLNVGSNIQPSGWYGTLANKKTSKAVGKIGVAPVPAGSGGSYPAVNILKGWLIGVNPNSKHEQAAWNFLSFALGKANVQSFINAGAPVPGRTSTLDSATYNKQLPYLKYLLPSIKSGTTLPTIPELTQITTDVCQAISKMANQNANVASTMKTLNSTVRTVLQQSGRVK